MNAQKIQKFTKVNREEIIDALLDRFLPRLSPYPAGMRVRHSEEARTDPKLSSGASRCLPIDDPVCMSKMTVCLGQEANALKGTRSELASRNCHSIIREI
jgi:hypothetical protein